MKKRDKIRNYIERQRIKRKIERHVNRLKRLPDEERNAILEAIKKEFYESN